MSTSRRCDNTGADHRDTTDTAADHSAIGVHRWGQRLWARLRESYATQAELHERVMLRMQPWLEDYLHWSFDGQEWHLHGHLPPPRDGRVPSVTGEGWCPGRQPR